jgi:hemolysin activation/secretion protein
MHDDRLVWRRAAVTCSLLGALAALMLLRPVAAQTTPNAAQALRESAVTPAPVAPPAPTPALPAASPVAPAAAVDTGPSFVLQQVSFSGNTVFDDATLAALLADRIGTRVDFGELQALALRITAHYQQAGYVLAQAILPAQELTAGRVQWSIVEGNLAQVRIERLASIRVPESAIMQALAPLQVGLPLRRQALERSMLLLGDLPGMTPQSALEPGIVPGTFDLIVELDAAPRVLASVDLDNYGARATGRYRAGAMVRVVSPLALGDNLDLRVLHTLGSGLAFGRVGYELPLGYTGLRAGLAYSRVSYELGNNLAALGASGRAGVGEFTLSYPLLRSRTRNLFLRVGFEHKKLSDDITVVQQAARKTVRTTSAGLLYEGRDGLAGGGFSNLGITAYAGHLAIDSAPDLARDQAANGLRTAGDFVRVSYQASRLQALSGPFSAFIGVAGQWARDNLDSAEKIAIGGPAAVRAYSSSAGIGDEGQVLNTELRWAVTPQASASFFYDVGRVRFSHAPLAGTDNHRTLRGPGVGLFWQFDGGLTLRSSIAWRLGGADQAGENRSPRLYAQLSRSL